MVLTLKLAEWSQADRLAEYAARVHGWGYRDVRMRQLASGGQEVCLVALRRKELRRLRPQAEVDARKESVFARGERASARRANSAPIRPTRRSPAPTSKCRSQPGPQI